jgi:amidase
MRYGRMLDRAANRVFDDHDLVITPTIPVLPRTVPALDGGFLRSTTRSILSVPYTAIWNATGNPAASIPVGFSAGGLPRAVQVIGPHNGETRIIQLAAQLEAELGWPSHRPPL